MVIPGKHFNTIKIVYKQLALEIFLVKASLNDLSGVLEGNKVVATNYVIYKDSLLRTMLLLNYSLYCKSGSHNRKVFGIPIPLYVLVLFLMFVLNLVHLAIVI